MSSVEIIPSIVWSLQQEFCGFFYVIQKNLFVGIGGKLGTIALEEWS
jgi:hypothetical protein